MWLKFYGIQCWLAWARCQTVSYGHSAASASRRHDQRMRQTQLIEDGEAVFFAQGSIPLWIWMHCTRYSVLSIRNCQGNIAILIYSTRGDLKWSILTNYTLFWWSVFSPLVSGLIAKGYIEGSWLITETDGFMAHIKCMNELMNGSSFNGFYV